MTPEPNQKKTHGRKRDRFRRFIGQSRKPTSSTSALEVEATQDRNADNAHLLPSPMPDPAFIAEVDGNNSASSTLWETAYDNLKNSDPKLIEEYEKLLSEQATVTKAAANNDTRQQRGHALAEDSEVRREQMNQILEEGFDMASSSELELRKRSANTVNVVSTFKSLIDEAVKMSPEASLAWAGVSFFLPMLTNVYTENEAFKEAFSYVTSRAQVYADLERELRSEVTYISPSTSSESFTLAFTELYAAVITFQAKATKRVFGKKAGEVLRDAFKWDGWKELSDAVKGAESALMDKIRSNQLRISTFTLVEIERKGQERHRLLKSSLEGLLEELKNISHRLDDQLATSKEQLGYMGREEARHITDEVNEYISLLHLTDPSDDKKRIEDTKGGLLKESYRWILENPEFQQWRNDEQNHLLWIKGGPGKGKTMLLCGIINELESMDSKKPLAYFFCQATQSSINKATAVLRGLLYLLFDQHPSLVSYMRKKYKHARKTLFEDHNAWVALSRIFIDVLQDPSLNNAHLIIDALDECVTGLPELLDLIVKASRVSSRIKWIVSSRNWDLIEERLEKAGTKMKLSLELNAASVSTAVQFYIRHKVAELALDKKYTEDVRSAVLDYLTLNAKDTFLWVALVCQNLGNTQRWNVLATMKKSFPPGLDDLYHRMMQQVSSSGDADRCRCILALISIVYRPVTLHELICLCEKLDDVADDIDAVRQIIGLCGSFLTIQRGSVYFVHQSAKDFLLTKASDQIFPSGSKEVHYRIHSRSLQILSGRLRRDMYSLNNPGYSIKQIISPAPGLDPLAAIRYSCVYWIDHLYDDEKYSACANSLTTLRDGGAVHRFLKEKYLYWLEALSLCKRVSKGVLCMAKLEALIIQRAEDTRSRSEVVEHVRDARLFITCHAEVIQNSPLQAYASALVFSPERSLTRRFFKREEPKWVTIKPAIGDRWNVCLKTLKGHNGQVSSVAFSHDSGLLVSASHDRTVKIWDASSGDCLQTLEDHDSWFISVAFSHDSAKLALASGLIVRIRDASSGDYIQMLEGHDGRVSSVAFSHDSARLASASHDKTVKIWDVRSGNCLQTLEGHSSQVNWVTFSHDSGLLASASHDKTVKIWDASSGNCLQTLKGHSKLVKSVSFSHDSARLASASEDNTVKVWDTRSGDCLQTLEGHSSWVNSVAFSHDSARLASASEDNTVKVWDTRSGDCLQTLEGHNKSVEIITFSPDSTRMASASVDTTIKIWDANSDYLQMPQGNSDWVNSVVFSHDSARLASASEDNTVKIWDVRSGDRLRTLEDHSGPVRSVAFSHDSAWVASGSKDETVKIWDASSGDCLQTLEGHTGWINSVVFSHDSARVASASADFRVRIWDARSGDCLQTLEDHTGWVNSVAFSHDSAWIASGLYGKVKIWDVRSGDCLRTLEEEDHRGPVTSIAFSHDLARLASASEYKTVKVWDASSGDCIQTIQARRILYSISFSISDSHLQTDIGVMDINALPSSGPFLDYLEPQSPQYQGLALSADGAWVTYDSENLLQLPSEYRPSRSAVSGNVIAFGESRNVWICQVRSHPISGRAFM